MTFFLLPIEKEIENYKGENIKKIFKYFFVGGLRSWRYAGIPRVVQVK